MITADILCFQIWQRFGVLKSFDVSMGLLLADGYHRAFDQYRWSLYCPGVSFYTESVEKQPVN